MEEQRLGPEHPFVSRTLSNLAETYYKEGRYTDAEPLYIRCLNITEKNLGRGHPDFTTQLSNYAQLLRKLHRKDDARKLEAQLKTLRLGPDARNRQTFQVDWRELQKRPNQ
jgi:hypothetical protein